MMTPVPEEVFLTIASEYIYCADILSRDRDGGVA